MRVTILGSGAWEGIPAAFCSCIVCTNAKRDPTSQNCRTRPGVLIETAKGAFLLEAGPDLRMQLARFEVPAVTDFVVSHWHYDHMNGLHDLSAWIKRSKNTPTVYSSPATRDIFDKEFCYLGLQFKDVRPFQEFSIHGVTVTPLPVYHMFNDDEGISEGSLANAYGYLLTQGRLRVAYLGDYYRIPRSTLTALKQVDILIADGTYLSVDTYKHYRPNHLHGADIIAFAQTINANKVYYHSISHLSGKLHSELQKSLPERHFISYDGLELTPD